MDWHTWHECNLQAPSCPAGHRCQVELPGLLLAIIHSLLSLWNKLCHIASDRLLLDPCRQGSVSTAL